MLLILSACGTQDQAEIDLEVDFMTNLGNAPIFSWKAKGADTDLTQAVFQVTVDGVWDSERLPAEKALQVAYSGPDLETGQTYKARVSVWDAEDELLGRSADLSFTIPLTYPHDWKAEWLGFPWEEGDALPLFRKAFKLKDPATIESARFYIAAPGFYEASLNGKKIGDAVLDPGQTNFEDYTYYSVYDLDPSDLEKENALGVIPGHGWYNQYKVWKGARYMPLMVYGKPVFICQLVIGRRDGSREIIGSDMSWRWTPGPVTYSNIYEGEHYDANREVRGWNLPGQAEGTWYEPIAPEVHPTQLYEQFAEPIRVTEEVQAVRIEEREDGSWLFDFGQNLGGWMTLNIKGEAGQVVTIKCAEVMRDNELDTITTGYRATKVVQTQQYTCRGGDPETWQPRFHYFGFRYAIVEGLKEAPGKELLTAQVLHSDYDFDGEFSCSEENINRLHQLARWTIRSNSQGILTDCPHREKCGWTGDAHAVARTAIYNFGIQQFLEKYVFDMRSSGREEKVELYFAESFHHRSMVTKPAGIPTMIVPGKRTSGTATPDWGTAMTQVPWYLYVYYGDRLLLEDFYPDMKVWVEYIEGIKEDGIIPHGLGDWCPPGGNVNIDCPVPVSSSAYHILDVAILEKTADLLGMEDDRKHYGELLEQLKADFNRHFFNEETRSYGSSQTANIMALDMEIVPAGLEKSVCEAIIRNIHGEFDGFLNTGIFGLARVFKVLSENGFEDEVYRLLSKTGENSFANMWDQFDVTTLWEPLPTRTEPGKS